MSGFLPPSTNGQYRGAMSAVWFLGLVTLLTLGPALIHSFAPSGGAEGIAGQLGTWMTCAVISSEAHAGVGGNMRETKQPAVNAAATENVATMRFILVLPSVLLAADAMPGANR